MKKLNISKGEWQPKQYKNSIIVNTQDLIEQRIICQVFGNDEETIDNIKFIDSKLIMTLEEDANQISIQLKRK
jgi:mRNA-degrading endonuclease HigB of HigAB toxin-antitoxin module